MTVGAQLGHHRVNRLIGSGGMGEVYLGHHTVLGGDVAIKRLTAADVAGRSRSRLLQEARAIASLDHPAGHGAVGLARVHGHLRRVAADRPLAS